MNKTNCPISERNLRGVLIEQGRMRRDFALVAPALRVSPLRLRGLNIGSISASLASAYPIKTIQEPRR
jgi:hypothetical protein